MTKWLKDPEGYEYRYVGTWKLGDICVEYKTSQPREPNVPFKRFVVGFRGEKWHVSAPSTEAAKFPFVSEFSRTGLRPKEVIVEEVSCK